MAAVGLGSLLACFGNSQGPTNNRFSVILVSIDTLRADRLNSYGYSRRQTSPNLDALGREGIVFESFITAAPWTTPAHLSMLTSLDPSAHGVTRSFTEAFRNVSQGGDFLRLPGSRVTIAEVLKDAGFRTAAFTAGGPLDPQFGFDQGFDEYSTSMYKLNERNMGEMFAWIERNQDRPFFLFWHHFEVHAPYLNADAVEDVVPAKVAAWLRAEIGALAAVPPQTLWPDGVQYQMLRETSILKQNHLFTRDVCDALYTSGVTSADRWLGRLVRFLRDRGLYEKTMIIVTSDHGEEMGERRSQDFYNVHGRTVYEEMIRVPLVIRLPDGVAAGTRVRQVTRTIDIMPTVLDLLGMPPANDEMQGTSLVQYWMTPQKAQEQVALTEALATLNEKKSFRTSRYKYVVNIPARFVRRLGRGRLPDGPLDAELYDLETDPSERVNLLQADRGEVVKRIAGELDRALRSRVSQNRGQADRIRLHEGTVERLKALGYIEE